MVRINRGTCHIWGAGDYYGNEGLPAAGDCVIAADGGADRASLAGVTPDLIIGDFDSIGPRPAPPGTDICRLPADKDDTDMLAAAKIGWQRGYIRFRIYGGLGGRIDHTLANLNLLNRITAAGGQALLYGSGSIVTALSRGSLSFPAWRPKGNRTISVLSSSDLSRGVWESGLRYEVEGMSMADTEVTGVSNEFLPGRPSRIEVAAGTVYVTYPDKAPEPTWATDMTAAPSLGEVTRERSRWLTVGRYLPEEPHEGEPDKERVSGRDEI